jgi:hypothetical protein
MNQHHAIMRETLEILKAHGFVPTVANGSKHMKIRWVDGNRTFTVVVSRSPSDRNAEHKARATLRRILRRSVAENEQRLTSS